MNFSPRPTTTAFVALVLAACGGPVMDPDTGTESVTSDDLDAAVGNEDAFTGEADTGETMSVDAAVPPDAFEEACPTEGAMRTTACGNCGLGSQRCTGGTWVTAGACVGEGECAAAAVETRTTDVCAEEARICQDSCTWTDWDEVSPASGECTRGETRIVPDGCGPGRNAVEECSDTCGWVATGECVDACGGVARTTPRLAEEICIPAGPFMRGDAAYEASMPVAEVMLSAYYIDRFVVSTARYRECVEAGACTLPPHELAIAQYEAPGRDEYPMGGVTHAQATAFCLWDGGRVLPTEAQWEKAARGPAPDMRIYPWGDEPDCAVLFNDDCGAGPMDSMILDEVDGLPMVTSPYGVEGMIGLGREWVGDWYLRTYYASPESLIDPVGPPGPSSVGRVQRGNSRFRHRWSTHLTARGNSLSTIYEEIFRCSRSAP